MTAAIIIGTILLILNIGILAKFPQLNSFTEAMDNAMDANWAGDEWKTKRLDIDKSYSNLNWSMPWNYNFDKMIVYKPSEL